MGRVKTSSGAGQSSKAADASSGRDSSFGSSYSADLKLKEALKELHQLTHQVQVRKYLWNY